MGSRIYTRGGDRGETGLLGGGRVAKASSRIEAVGSVDELNALVGLAIAQLAGTETGCRLAELQPDLFVIGSHLVAPAGSEFIGALPALPDARPAEMESWIDQVESTLPPLSRFVMPGGSVAGATLHLARTVCRRAERAVLRLDAEEAVPAGIIVYLNRLSDLFFTLARGVNHVSGAAEVQWLPAVAPSTSPPAPTLPARATPAQISALHRCRIVSRELVATDTLAIRVERPAAFVFEAGQYADVTIPEMADRDALGPVRSLSIASSPDAPHLEFVFRMRDTAFKRALATLPLGTEVHVEGPLDDMGPMAGEGRPLVFIAGGVGVAPFMSVLRHALAAGNALPATLFYSNRRPEDAAYLDELRQMEPQLRGFRLVATMTRAEGHGWAGETERVGPAMIHRFLPSLEGPAYYLAGSPLFISSLRSALVDAGVPEANIALEMYTGY